jgi:lactate dehydrogenase-like 2-hydroxyacid dehydrogenase
MPKNCIVFEWAQYEQDVLTSLDLDYSRAELTSDRFNLQKAKGKEVVSIFVDSKISDEELKELAESGTKKVVIRAVGTDMLNIEVAKTLGIEIYRVASYSPGL